MNAPVYEVPVQQVQSSKTVIAYLKMQYANLVWEEKLITEKKKAIIDKIAVLNSEKVSIRRNNIYNFFQRIVSQFWNDLLQQFKSKYNPDVCNMAPHLQDVSASQIVLTCQSHTSNLWNIYKADKVFMISLEESYRAFISIDDNDKDGKLAVLREYQKNYKQFLLRKDQRVIVYDNMLAIKSSDGRPYTPISNEIAVPADHDEDLNENLIGQTQVGYFDVEDDFDFDFTSFDFETGIVPDTSTQAQKRQRIVNNNNCQSVKQYF
jgi:hypothetical protein